MADESAGVILCDGGLGGVLACAAAASGRSPALDVSRWVVLADGGAVDHERDARLRAVQEHALIHGLEFGGEAPATEWAQPGRHESGALLWAAWRAVELGARTLIWSVAAGDDLAEVTLDRVADILDRCELVSRLASLEAVLRIESPHADLSGDQLAELAVDMALPVESCWWWTADATRRAGWDTRLSAFGWSGSLTQGKSGENSGREGAPQVGARVSRA